MEAEDWFGPETATFGDRLAAGEGAVRLVTVQPPGKKAMAAEAMLNGQPELLGAQLRTGDDYA